MDQSVLVSLEKRRVYDVRGKGGREKEVHSGRRVRWCRLRKKRKVREGGSSESYSVRPWTEELDGDWIRRQPWYVVCVYVCSYKGVYVQELRDMFVDSTGLFFVFSCEAFAFSLWLSKRGEDPASLPMV